MVGFPLDSRVTFDDATGEPVYDRAVSSQPLRKLIRDLFTTGVMPNPSTNFQVSAGTDGMTVVVNPGFAVVDGGLCQETEVRTLEVTAADNTYDRIDTVVLRWNENIDVRNPDLYVIQGTPSASPVRPELQRGNSIYEIGLADVFITKRVATITNDKITDTRYETERCGIVSSVSEWDTTTIYQQIQADLTMFKTTEQAEILLWFEHMKDQLSEDAAVNLQLQIDDIVSTMVSIDNDKYTWDEYNALPQATKMDHKIRQVGGGHGIHAAVVPYDNTESGLDAEDVQAAVDEVSERASNSTFGNEVPLTENTDYVCHSDGYFHIRCSNVNGSYAYGYINGILMLAVSTPSSQYSTAYPNLAVPVRKGMTLKVVSNSGSGVFRPLE